MTLDKAIKKAERIAEEKFNNAVYIMDKMKNAVALENAEECKRCAEEHRQLADWLKELKKIKEQTRWTPISEGPPKTEQYVFITIYNQTKMCWYQNGVFVDGEQNAYTKEDEELVAWMPFQIPEPYKTESEE